jgi:hypothetical protein
MYYMWGHVGVLQVSLGPTCKLEMLPGGAGWLPTVHYCCAPRAGCRAPSACADDAVASGYQGNTVLQRFKLTGKAALITGRHHT